MIHTICVCGAGTMGSGIAQVAAQSGFHTILFDLNKEVLAKAQTSIGKNLDSLVVKQKLSAEQKHTIFQSIQFSSNINDCIADVIIEAIIEKVEAKVSLFNQLAAINHSETIFASNTSSLSVSSIAANVVHPSRVAGMHFFNPAPFMKLVEVVKGDQTTEQVIETLSALTLQMNKTPVICKDAPGFIVNRVARHYYLEALKLVELGLADITTVDDVLESIGFKMGPFRLMDLIGNDINFAVTESLYKACGEPVRFEPSPIQREKVEKGELGKKTGTGYYQY